MATLNRELELDLRLQELLEAPAHEDKLIQLACKRALDIAVALMLLIALAVPSLLIAAIIRLDSHGPVLLRQWRVGKYGHLFRVCKFRTMVDRADELVAELADHNEHAGPLFKIRSDPRMTRVGRWLRKTSIDELPQLINVLRGDMSLVGPRPPLPREVQVYNHHQLGRLATKPGMTGLWQVSGRSTLTFDEMVDLDLEYIATWSFRRDIVLLIKTVPAVVSTRGAY